MDDKNEDNVTINQLPDEILLNIFEFLNRETLKNSVLVCKRWNELITMDRKIMKKLPLRIRRSTLIGQFEFKRKYHTIQVEEEYPIDLAESLLHISELRVLKFHNFHFGSDKAAAINKLFSSLDKLEVWECYCISLEFDFFDQLESHNLASLKKVKMSFSNSKIFVLILSTQITSLIVERPIGRCPFVYLFVYLVKQTQLEILKLDDAGFDSNRINSCECIFNWGLILLTFKKLHNLKTLVISAYELPEKDWFEQLHLQPNCSVRSLQIRVTLQNTYDFKAMFPNANIQIN